MLGPWTTKPIIRNEGTKKSAGPLKVTLRSITNVRLSLTAEGGGGGRGDGQGRGSLTPTSPSYRFLPISFHSEHGCAEAPDPPFLRPFLPIHIQEFIIHPLSLPTRHLDLCFLLICRLSSRLPRCLLPQLDISSIWDCYRRRELRHPYPHVLLEGNEEWRSFARFEVYGGDAEDARAVILLRGPGALRGVLGGAFGVR